MEGIKFLKKNLKFLGYIIFKNIYKLQQCCSPFWRSNFLRGGKTSKKLNVYDIF